MNDPKLKYVCLSDFHLGAPNSLLTAVEQDVLHGRIQPAPSATPATLQTLADTLADFLPALSDPQDPPTLILLGDVLDLGFSPAHVVVMAYQRFLDAMFPKDRPRLFAKEIIFIPGNHDHSLWHHGKMEHFLAQMALADRTRVNPLRHTTPLLAKPSLRCHLLDEILQTHDPESGYSVRMAYPNFGAINKDRAVILHHGHFIESTYRLMSEVATSLFGGHDPAALDISEIERINGTWIDFGWCGLGDPGETTYTLYSLLQDPAALHTFTTALTTRVHKEIMKIVPMSGLRSTQHLVYGVTNAVLDFVIARGAELERNSYQSVLSGDSLKGLKWYIGKVLLAHLRDEFKDKSNRDLDYAENLGLPREINFLFGHTHKPFEDQVIVDEHPWPVNVFNTGGWVLDVPQPAPTQGASMLLIDDALRVGSVRLFNCALNGEMQPVRVEGARSPANEETPWLDLLRTQLPAHATAWDRFSRAVQADIDQRFSLMHRQFFNPTASAKFASIVHQPALA